MGLQLPQAPKRSIHQDLTHICMNPCRPGPLLNMHLMNGDKCIVITYKVRLSTGQSSDSVHSLDVTLSRLFEVTCGNLYRPMLVQREVWIMAFPYLSSQSVVELLGSQ